MQYNINVLARCAKREVNMVVLALVGLLGLVAVGMLGVLVYHV